MSGMTEVEIAAVLNQAALVALFILTVLGAASTVGRAGRWAKEGIPPPVLLIRDSFLMVGLAFPFVVIMAARVFAVPREVTQTVPWVLMTSGPAVAALAVYVYFEFFVIGKGRR